MKHNNRPARICSWLLAVAMVFSLMTGMGINTSVYAAEDTDKTAQSVEADADLAEGTGSQGSDTTAASESTVSEISTQEADGSTPEVSAAVDGQTAETEAVTASWNTYTLSSYSDTDKFLADNTTPLQHVVLRLTFNEDVEITDSSALNDCIFGANPTLTIMIAGTTADCSIADAGYYRPCTYSTSGKDLIIDIGNCINKDTGAAGFTAMYIVWQDRRPLLIRLYSLMFQTENSTQMLLSGQMPQGSQRVMRTASSGRLIRSRVNSLPLCCIGMLSIRIYLQLKRMTFRPSPMAPVSAPLQRPQ